MTLAASPNTKQHCRMIAIEDPFLCLACQKEQGLHVHESF